MDPWGLAKCPNLSFGKEGEILSAKTTVTLADLGKGTATNATSRAWARMMGRPTDAAGHILGKVLGGHGGKGNVFPQLPAINHGEYRMFEKQVRQYIKNNGSVDIEWTFKYANGGTRPTGVQYDVLQNNEIILSDIFRN